MKIIKSNTEFIKKYGKIEFYEMCKYIPQELALAKINKIIGGYKVSNRKKRVKFYRKDSRGVYLDFATIFSLGCQYIDNYINGSDFE